jgi:hypothetical protein
MTIVQLQLNLWQQLEQAHVEPQKVDWQQLCLAFDEAIAQTPIKQQLAIAGNALFEMAEVLAVRAEEMWGQWGQSDEDGPVLGDELFLEFVRQSLSLDLSDLVSVPQLYERSTSEREHGDAETQVEYRDKAVVLAELESVVGEEGEGAIEVLEYDENVSGWSAVVREWLLTQKVEPVKLSEIFDALDLSIVQLWLAILLGGFEPKQVNKDPKFFYSLDGIVVHTGAIL